MTLNTSWQRHVTFVVDFYYLLCFFYWRTYICPSHAGLSIHRPFSYHRMSQCLSHVTNSYNIVNTCTKQNWFFTAGWARSFDYGGLVWSTSEVAFTSGNSFVILVVKWHGIMYACCFCFNYCFRYLAATVHCLVASINAVNLKSPLSSSIHTVCGY